ncbi:MAG: insulinase family protein [Bacteroidetes bacterium]|nr:insulinase family protein [Bacteroidota bacterium]
MSKWENNQSRGFEMAQAFAQGLEWEEYLVMNNQVALVKKEDVVRVATQYYGDNYLMFISKMGFPKKEKLEKPGFDPVIPKNEQMSTYYEQWRQIKESPQKPKFVNVEEDINKVKVNEMITVYAAKNPFNEIFSAEIKWGVGTYAHPELKYVAEYLNLAGSEQYPATELKEALYKLGCSYSFSANDKEFILKLDGIEYNFPSAIAIIRGLIQQPLVDNQKVKKVQSDLAATNKIMRREPSHIASALQQYVLYGENSSFLRDLPKSKIKKLTAQGLIDVFEIAKNYEITVFYTGKQKAENVGSALLGGFPMRQDIKPKTPTIVLDRNIPEEHTVCLVKKKKAVQSQLNFMIEGKQFNQDDIPAIEAFNEYFGGNMSSLVFQEIREFRSLAYAASAHYRPARLAGKNNFFSGYIGCQGDKTIEALEAMLVLIKDMPEKKEREEAIISALVQASGAARPEFRDILTTYEKWFDQGYLADPNLKKIEVYPTLNFSNVKHVYENHIKGKNIYITVVGNKKTFKTKELKKHGKLIKVREKKLFVN